MRRLRVVVLAGISLVACHDAKRDSASAKPKNPSAEQAAKETEIEALRLLDDPSPEGRLTKLGVSLGYVEETTHPGGGQYLCGGLTSDESRAAGTVVATALARLPDASLERLGLRYVILCGQAMAGSRRIGGIPVPPLNLLMLDVGASGRNQAYLQHLFLHELYHLIEYRFNTFNDADWQARFGTGYASGYGSEGTQSTIGSGKRGFLNSYSETFPHEDRAELFALLLLEPAAVDAHIQTAGDDPLRQKVQYMVEKVDRLIGLRIQP